MNTEMYYVSGCGVTLICEKGESMKEWIKYMVARGGVVIIELITKAAA